MRQIGWMALAKRLWKRINDHDLFGRAAQLAYYFLLALFPLLLFLMTLLGYFARAGSHLRNLLLRYLATVMPSAPVKLFHTTLDEVSNSRSGGKLWFGLVAALWLASNGMAAIADALNIAHNVKETRRWWRVRLVSLGLTVATAVATISALMIVLYGRRIGDVIALSFGYEDSFKLAWRIMQWPIALVFVLITFNLILHFAPNLARRNWRWSTPGGVVAVALWLLVSFGLRLYLNFFDTYSRTYGSLGALIVLMLWFYLTGLAILIGGEINSEIEGIKTLPAS
jgi:membrane protein